jgi:hypothetical protein
MPGTLKQYQREHNIETSYVSLWIEENNKEVPEIYYCSRCKCPVFQFKGNLVTEIPGGSPCKVPIIKQCPNKTCGRKYYVTAVVK